MKERAFTKRADRLPLRPSFSLNLLFQSTQLGSETRVFILFRRLKVANAVFGTVHVIQTQ